MYINGRPNNDNVASSFHYDYTRRIIGFLRANYIFSRYFWHWTRPNPTHRWSHALSANTYRPTRRLLTELHGTVINCRPRPTHCSYRTDAIALYCTVQYSAMADLYRQCGAAMRSVRYFYMSARIIFRGRVSRPRPSISFYPFHCLSCFWHWTRPNLTRPVDGPDPCPTMNRYSLFWWL